ncbi:uncharacterized protein LOC113351750 [Papaver somniferum]|uniref:uncharacterized protein LOC113351750 n=1 Tax=Papaver somniferum TaxID=3469 RepID=UPI000E6F9C32|nr:uncharacterized protein LOC113351750 [Papaver somniferum]
MRIGRPRQSVVGRSSFRNCVRGLTYQVGFVKYYLSPLETCSKCQAKIFHRESENFCCGYGKISLQLVEPPLALLELFDDQGPRGKQFRINIRSYNRCFAFTSMGVYFDMDLADGTEGVYTFRIQGHHYRKIGSLFPIENASRPRYVLIYFYDRNQEIGWRIKKGNDVLDRDVLKMFREILNRHNSFFHVFRQGAEREDLLDCQLIIKEQPKDQLQYTLPTASQVASIVPIGDKSYEHTKREIIVQARTMNLLKVFETGGNYDPMQYPLFLPYGSYGWDIESKDNNGRKKSCRGYYSCILQMRNNHDSLFLRGGRLLQQYVVDNWVKIDSARFRWITGHQNKLRAELYEGLQDAQIVGETIVDELSKNIVLPSSYIGGLRDMYQRYQDAMALVQKYGKPDIFLTMTCNPLWPEIVANIRPGQSASDRPDLTTRKRGLPHVHMLIILEKEDKLQGPDDYDRIVRTEIRDKNKEPELYKRVKKWMIYGPCGSKCMLEGKCKRGFPKQFSECTLQGKDAYPVYQRREDGNTIRMSKKFIADNRFVVPYNP